MGGLGNQMFQYAFGRALSLRHSSRLLLDASSGFTSDRVFRRAFELERFPIQGEKAGLGRRFVFQAERAWNRLHPRRSLSTTRPWGVQIEERSLDFDPSAVELPIKKSTWLRGYWQSESYFSDHRIEIGKELSPSPPVAKNFLEMAAEIKACNSVGVGVRLFEEVPKNVTGQFASVTPIEFYRTAALRISKQIDNPVFFVFCTKRFPILESLNLPGETRFVTHDEGFHGAVDRLWLMSQCQHHVISHSSFYWWAAWLAEQRDPSTQVVASEAFPGNRSIPDRWHRVGL
jgi:hypothetical protein